MATRNAADEIRAAITEKIRNNFDHTAVSGLTEDPTITQNPRRKTDEPYIYVYSVSQLEIDVNKDDTPYEYIFNVEVCTRYNSYRGGQRQSDEMLDQVLQIVRGKTRADYPDLEAFGFNVYRITSGEIVNTTQRDRGANYYKVICPIHVVAQPIAQPSQLQPVQALNFAYSDFMYTPTNFRIERYDTGDITPATTYPSGNNGWNFIDASYGISSGATGTLIGGVYSTVANGVTGLDSSLRYSLDSDSTETTTITDTTAWTQIDSIRYGAVTPVTDGVLPSLTDDTAATYGLRNLSNWNIEYGTVTPHNETITITGTAGQYLYIIIDHETTLTQIRNSVGQNAIGLFDVTTVGDYKVYIHTQPIVFDGFSTDFTLIE